MMPTSRITGRIAAATAVVVTLSIAPAAVALGHATHPAVASHRVVAQASPSKKSLLHPKKKYFGVFVSGAPVSLTPLTTIKQQTGKEPNLDVWYQDWGSGAAKGTVNFLGGAAKQACAAGVLPMYTWESWNTNIQKQGEGAAYAQKPFAAKKVTGGKYDKYIRNMAKAIRAIHCPIAVRFDQEQNGYWYPWGLRTKGMGSLQDTPKQYIAMWRHVWQIFHDERATNVLWTWSPNFQGFPRKGLASLRASYPGNKYVDWVGVDGYYVNDPSQTFTKLFGHTISQLKQFASSKPWIVSETAVGTGPTKPKQITNLLNSIASRKEFNGFSYFDFYQPGLRSDWKFDETAASLRAFKAGVDKAAFGSAKPGTL